MSQYSNEKQTLISEIAALQSRLDTLERLKRDGDAPEEMLNKSIAIEKDSIAKKRSELNKISEQ